MTIIQKSKQFQIIFRQMFINVKKSLNYLLEEGCKISKVGENLMRKFEFNHQNYQDLCYEKNHNNLLNKTHAESLFYFGSSSSLGLAAEVFNKKNLLLMKQII